MSSQLNHLDYYRLPWSYSDNGISWLEPTTACNIRCEGCYRNKSANGHKTLNDVRADLEVFKRLRKSDCISIAGGDPLVYPQIVEVVKIINEMGWKPIVNTNGKALDEPLLKDLKKAGVFGFTFHIDTSQHRPEIKTSSEAELNALRLHYAEMLARIGDIACAFNATVSQKTCHEIPELVRWAEKHADIVHTMVFILYRSPHLSADFDLFANGERIELGGIYEETKWGGEKSLMAQDIVDKIREADPYYEPCAYLNGTANPDSLKWLLANRIVHEGEAMGYVSPKFMEVVQTLNHIITGKYLAYTKPRSVSLGKLASFAFSPFDKKMRRIAGRLFSRMLRNPKNMMNPAYIQSFMIIQPLNIELDGRPDMCDSCPDITVYDGKLVWSCRLEEMNTYGVFAQAVPKKE